MKRIISLSTVALLGCRALLAADSSPADQVKEALAKLKAQPNYSWTAKMDMAGGRFTPRPTQGKTDKDGFMLVTQPMSNNLVQAVIKGDKACVKVEDEWLLISELEPPTGGGFNRGAMMSRMLARTRQPAEEASELLGKVKELKADDGGVYRGDLTEEGAKDLLTFGGRRPNAGNAPPAPKNPKGTAKFWLKDGLLVKFESNLEGTMTFRGEDREMKRTRTVEIQDIGTTKLDLPAEAKKKLSK